MNIEQSYAFLVLWPTFEVANNEFLLTVTSPFKRNLLSVLLYSAPRKLGLGFRNHQPRGSEKNLNQSQFIPKILPRGSA